MLTSTMSTSRNPAFLRLGSRPAPIVVAWRVDKITGLVPAAAGRVAKGKHPEGRGLSHLLDQRAAQGLTHDLAQGRALSRSSTLGLLDEVVVQHAGQQVALVSHTVVNRVLLCAVLGWGNERFWRLRQETCAVNVFDVDEDGDFTIGLLIDTSHLQGLFQS